MDDGEPLWTLEVAEGYNPLNWRCNIHGFFVDGDYAYGGLAQSGNHLNGSNIIGRMFKIDISLEEPEVVDIWYPFDPALTAAYDEPHWSYLGAGAYNFPALIDDYLVFGTGQIYRTPKYIDDCLLGDDESDYNESLPFDQSVSTDVCGNDRSDDRFWRCLEKDVYPDSLIILNKNTFDIVAAIPMQGIDVYFWSSCWTSTSYAPWACPSVREGDNRPNQGPNADVSAVATFRYNGKLYAAASQKPSQLIVVEIPSGNLVVSKSFGPWYVTHRNMCIYKYL